MGHAEVMRTNRVCGAGRLRHADLWVRRAESTQRCELRGADAVAGEAELRVDGAARAHPKAERQRVLEAEGQNHQLEDLDEEGKRGYIT